MAFSNEEWVNRYGGDESFLEIWDAIDRHIATNLHTLFRLCTSARLTGSPLLPASKAYDVQNTAHLVRLRDDHGNCCKRRYPSARLRQLL